MSRPIGLPLAGTPAALKRVPLWPVQMVQATFLVLVWVSPLSSYAADYDFLIRALKERQARIKSIDLSWNAVNDYSLSYVRELAGRRDPFGDANPPAKAVDKPLLISWKGRLAISGDRLHWENNFPLWYQDKAEFTQKSRKAVWDGQQFRELRQSLPPSPFPFQGQLAGLQDMKLHVFGIPAHRALFWHLQPLPREQSSHGFARTLVPDATIAVERKEGADLLVISKTEIGKRGDRIGHTLILDPSRDYSLRQYSRTSNGFLQERLSFEFVQNGQGIWAPSAWRDERFNGLGQLQQSQTATVTRCVINEEVDAKVFQLDFPNWTLVSDRLRGPDEVWYLVLPGGKERILSREELSPPKGKAIRKEDFLPKDTVL